MKFRIYSKQLKSYVAPEEYFVNGNGDVFFFDMMEGELVKAQKKDFVVQRGTEECDVNGTYIYEGDRVRSIRGANAEMILARVFEKKTNLEEFTGAEIKYRKEGLVVWQAKKGDVPISSFYCCHEDQWGLEVIGTIFDEQK